MKKISVVMMGLVLLFTNLGTMAQAGSHSPLGIEPYQLEVGLKKTTSLIFPEEIKSVDRGSGDLLVQKAKGLENVLQVKAAKESFEETSLTVITAVGKVYVFLVNFSANPPALSLKIDEGGRGFGGGRFSGQGYNEAEVRHYAETALVSTDHKRWRSKRRFGMDISLNGIFIHDEVMYLRLRIENSSNIGYDIDQLRMFIRDEKKAKRTATQETELAPLFIHQDIQQIAPTSGNSFVFAFPKFTIPDNKYLIIQLMESNGGRHLQLAVRNRTLIKASPLP